MGLIKEVGKVRNRALLILFTAIIFLSLINNIEAVPIAPFNTTNKIPVSDVFPTNSTTVWATVLFNFTSAHGPGTTNVSNATFYINNTATGTITNIGTNTTANLTSYSVRYGTSAVADGNYTMIINVSNFTNPSNPYPSTINSTYFSGNFSIDNTGPTLLVVTVPNQTNGTYGPESNVVNVTITPEIEDTIFNCTLIANGTIVNGTFAGNGTLIGWNWTSNPIINLTHGFYTANLTCDESAKDLNLRRGPVTTVQSNQFIVDLRTPGLNIIFKDKNGEEGIEFLFGDPVDIDCNPSDDGTGIVAMTINVSVRRPGIGSFENLSIGSTNVPKDKVGDVRFTETFELGEYLARCIIEDAFGAINATYKNVTNKTFSIKKKPPISSSAFGIPGFQEPIANKVIGVGIVNNIGEISETGEARLIAQDGGVIFTIDGAEHRVVVDELTEGAVTLLVDESQSQLNSGDVKQFDLNNDNLNELEITLNMIYHKKADLIFKRIAVQAPPPAQPPGEQPPAEQPPAEAEKKGRGIVISGLIILIIVIAVVVVLHFVRKRGEGKEPVRFRPRDLGAGREEFYASPPPNKTQGTSNPPFAF